MNEADHLAQVRCWLGFAREDLAAAQAMLGRQEMVPRHAPAGSLSRPPRRR